MDISIIIPAKDEASRLPVFLPSVIEFCRNGEMDCEIIVVDDGSTDGTSASAQGFQGQWPDLKVIRLERNRGKGFAVKRGFEEARGDILLFMDADGSTPVEEIGRNAHWLKEGYDIVIGSRVIREPGVSVQARLHRKCMGALFNTLVHTFLIKDIKDTQCGFKMFRRAIARPLFAHMQIDGFGFDLEILYLARKMGYKIKETAVNWRHVEGGKVNLFTDPARMLSNIFQIRSMHA